MITIERETVEQGPDILKATAVGELTLTDYQQLETAINEVHAGGEPVQLRLDLTQMVGFTIDAAWEDLRFMGKHGQDLGHVAVVTTDQWMTWASWINAAFTDAEVRIFEDATAADAWLTEVSVD